MPDCSFYVWKELISNSVKTSGPSAIEATVGYLLTTSIMMLKTSSL